MFPSWRKKFAGNKNGVAVAQTPQASPAACAIPSFEETIYAAAHARTEQANDTIGYQQKCLDHVSRAVSEEVALLKRYGGTRGQIPLPVGMSDSSIRTLVQSFEQSGWPSVAVMTIKAGYGHGYGPGDYLIFDYAEQALPRVQQVSARALASPDSHGSAHESERRPLVQNSGNRTP